MTAFNGKRLFGLFQRPLHGKGVDSFHRFSLLPLEGGGAQRRRLASLSFAFGKPPALRASPFHGKGVDGLLIPLLPPSSGRRWRVAPEVGFTLFFLRPTPCPSGISLPREGGRWFFTASPSFLWKEVARSAGGWLRSQPLSIKKRTPHRSPPILPASIS